MAAFGCSDKKTPTPKTQDSPKPVASPTTTITNPPEEKQISKPQSTQEEVSSPAPSPHVSGLKAQVSGASIPHVSGIQTHISGQPRYSSNVSGSQSHISGRTTRPHFSGQ